MYNDIKLERDFIILREKALYRFLRNAILMKTMTERR